MSVQGEWRVEGVGESVQEERRIGEEGEFVQERGDGWRGDGRTGKVWSGRVVMPSCRIGLVATVIEPGFFHPKCIGAECMDKLSCITT